MAQRAFSIRQPAELRYEKVGNRILQSNNTPDVFLIISLVANCECVSRAASLFNPMCESVSGPENKGVIAPLTAQLNIQRRTGQLAKGSTRRVFTNSIHRFTFIISV